MENNNPTSGGSEKNDEQLQAVSSKSQIDTQHKMWCSSDGLLGSSNGRESRVENIELLVQDSHGRQSPYPEGLFFRDGQRKIDFVLVYESSGDEEDRKAATRKIYQDNLIKQHGLELEEEISLQVISFYYTISKS